MKRYKFLANVNGKEVHPKGFYYQGKHIILVGDTVENHTIRRKEKIEDVEIHIFEVDEDEKDFHVKRRKAMKWWNDLPEFGNPALSGKHGLTTKYYNSRMFQSLTGREIQHIWENEVKE